MADAISADGTTISSVDECDKCGRQMRKMQIPDEFGGEPGGSPFCMPCVRSCYEINYTDCAGWFFEIKEENAAVPGRCSSGGRALSADRSEAETGEAF